MPPGFNAGAWNAYIANFAADTPPAPTVQQQMQAYLQTEQSFSKDLGTLGKQGLNRQLISQLVAAGPAQGDRSPRASSAAPAGPGRSTSCTRRSARRPRNSGDSGRRPLRGASRHFRGQFSAGGVTININVPAGAGGGVALTTAQINSITAQVQAALLKQAKRNRTTGIALHNKQA